MSDIISRDAALLALLVLTACGGEGSPQPANPEVPVTVVTLRAESVTLTRELPGRTTPFLVAEVRPQVSGIVKARLFREGGLVKAGQPLYQLEDATYRASLDSARAALARAKASLVTAKLNHQRATELVRTGVVSRQDFEDATAVFRQAQADVMAAEADVQSSAVTLGHARITAPIGGRIGKSSVTAGALVTANQAEPLATIQQLDPINVDVNVPSNEVLQMRRELAAGTFERARDVPVQILLEDGSRFAYDGKLAFVEVSVDPTTGNSSLRIDVPNPDHLLLPGMYVRALVAGGVRENAILVPQQGVARDAAGNTTVMLVNAQNKVEQHPIRVSQTIGDRWLVESGLTAGDRVIVEGLQKIRPGVPVRPAEREGSPGEASAAAPIAGSQ